MRTIQRTNHLMSKDLDRFEERRLNAIIVAVTVTVILTAVLALIAIADSFEPAAGDGSRDVPASVD